MSEALRADRTAGRALPPTSKRWKAIWTAPLVAKVAVVAFALGLWQLLSAVGVLKADVFPSMSSTMDALGRQLGTTNAWSAIGDTLAGWAVGLAVGGLSAIVIGSLIGSSRAAYRSTIPVVEFLKTVPVVAILPLAILTLGTTLMMKVFLVAFGVFWPLVIQVVYGVRAVDPTLRDTAASLQIRGLRRFFVVVLPSAGPFIATGLRISAAVALVLDIVAELFGGGRGLGQQILQAQNAGPTAFPIMYAFIVITGVVGILVTGMFGQMEKRALHWHESQRSTENVGL